MVTILITIKQGLDDEEKFIKLVVDLKIRFTVFEGDSRESECVGCS